MGIFCAFIIMALAGGLPASFGALHLAVPGKHPHVSSSTTSPSETTTVPSTEKPPETTTSAQTPFPFEDEDASDEYYAEDEVALAEEGKAEGVDLALALEYNEDLEAAMDVTLHKRQITEEDSPPTPRVVRLAPANVADAEIPVNGPYTGIAGSGFAGPSDSGDGEGGGDKDSFRSWNEYSDARRSIIMGGVKGSLDGDRKASTGTGYVPVMDPDDHFRYMDKLYQAKNERVRLFHDLYLYSMKVGKTVKDEAVSSFLT